MRSTPITPDLVRGAVELEPTEHGLLPHRLPPGRAPRCPTTDQLHPDAETHRRIGERFAERPLLR